MRKILIAAAIAVLGTSAAQAQGTWAGTYTGINAGGSWSNSGGSNSATCGAPGGLDVYICNSNDPTAASELLNSLVRSTSGGQFTGGAHAGINWQSGAFVYGIESDLGYLNIGKRQTGTGVYTTGGGGGASLGGDAFWVNTSASSDFLFTFRGRLGYAISPSLLAYGTGGLAVGRTTVSSNYLDTHNHGGPLGGNGAITTEQFKLGWTAGAGLEYAYARNWTVRAEYMYVDLGTSTASMLINNPPHAPEYTPFSTSYDMTSHILRAGLSYRFQ
ncbi:MAG: porin family protein [Afipia sp.]|nr:porin family protein [Afipia sp.]